MYIETIVLSISVVLQFLAAILALRLTRVTGWFGAWTLIAAAIILMALRRSITLFKFYSGEFAPRPDLDTELVALTISTLMVVGLAWVIPLFKKMKASQQKVENSEAQYRAVLDNMDETLYHTDANGLVVMVSPALINLVGYRPEEQIGKKLSNLYKYPKGRDEFLQALTSGGGRVSNYEAALINKDGKETWVSTNARFLKDGQGNITGVEGVARNITEQRNLSLQLQQSQKMDAVGRLAGGIAHDFNNLLQAITGFTQLALDQIPSDSPPYRYLETVLTSSNKGANLTRQLLTFSRQEVLTPEILDLSVLISDQLNMVDRLIGENIEVGIISNGQSFWVVADAGLIEQVVLNLCVNSRDAMPDGGRIDIEISQVELDDTNCREMGGLKPGAYVELKVRDTGTGIPREIRDKIFEPFFTTKKVGQGTGLGLSMVIGIVKQHKGHIVVDNFQGEGTTFRLLLPASEAPKENINTQLTKKYGESVLGGSETVLVAEDNSAVRELVCDVLKDAGYSVLAASDGLEALELLKKECGRIDLFLLDVVMPGMSGRVLYSHIQEVAPEKPIIFSTGYTGQNMDAQFLQEHSLNFIRKPFSPKDLLTMLRNALDAARSKAIE